MSAGLGMTGGVGAGERQLRAVFLHEEAGCQQGVPTVIVHSVTG